MRRLLPIACAVMLAGCATSPRLFACGESPRCDARSQYCAVVHSGVQPPPGVSGVHAQCQALPTPDCSQAGPYVCKGMARSGITVDVLLPAPPPPRPMQE